MPNPLLSALTGDAEIAALLGDDAQLSAMLVFERALAEAEAEAGLIPDAAATAIGQAIATFVPDRPRLAQGMAIDGVVVPELVRQLRAAVDEPHGKALHFGATSQDVVDTALMLQLGHIIPVLVARIAALQLRFDALAAEYGARPLMAQTRMQAALPFTVADRLRSWSEPLDRHRRALLALRPELLVIQLGGPVGDRTSFAGKGEQVARALARILDLGIAPSWQSTRDPIVMFGARAAALAGSLGKFGADVALMAQTEVATIRLAGGGGSSAMAHKRNPVAAEVLVALARHAAGLCGTLQQAMVHENERSGAAWTLEWLTLPPLLEATGASLLLAQRLAGDIAFA